MTKLFISLGIGIIAGIIDIIPMVLQKLDRYSIISAFIHWVILGFIISYTQLPFQGWLKGLIVAEISAIPIVVLVFKDDPKSIYPILFMSAILGCIVGFSTAKFAI
ncbi:MAG: hypothetical protein GY714_03520 [Desulfobacterales bacterium]|nr:hypothetical protein [Desulfobacterales bacterium]